MTSNDLNLADVVSTLRRSRTDLRTIEARAAGGGLPKTTADTLSAFSNDVGGVLVLGLDESSGFRPAEGFDAVAVRDALAGVCADALQPPVRAAIDIEEVDGAPVVVAVVPELPADQKPCYVQRYGEYRGSFTRGGDGDRRFAEYEIQQLHANRGQPRNDIDPVPGARLDDLDPDAVSALLRRVRLREPAAFSPVDDTTALRRLRVLVPDGDRLAVSLAGLLALGAYPQEFLPQLVVTFVAFPATSKDTVPPGAPRFLDNRSLTGTVPRMVQDTVATVLRNSHVAGHVVGVGRSDTYDYPVEAVRESITNALMHRDYSPLARGAQVQVEMYLDRMEVRSPGGLFGPVTEDDLGSEGVSSSRNAHLARLLQDVVLPGTEQVVCENRGTGIPAMLAALRRAGLTVPVFRSSLTSFVVTLPKHALMDSGTHAWLASLGQDGLTDPQFLALALMRDRRAVTNATLRQVGLDRIDATQALADLVARGLAVKSGGRRYAEYRLDPDLTTGSGSPTAAATRLMLPFAAGGEAGDDVAPQAEPRRYDRTDDVARLFEDGSTLTVHEVAVQVGLGRAMATRYLTKLVAAGRLDATAPPRAKGRAYRRPATSTPPPARR